MPPEASCRTSASGHGFRSGRDHDAIERRPAWNAFQPVPEHDLDIAVAESFEPCSRRLGQRAIALDRVHLARQAGQDRGLVSGSGSDLQHAMIG